MTSKPSDALFQITRARDIPLLCTFEVTRSCNLRCRHCYLAPVTRARTNGELTTAEIKKTLRALAAAGTLMLTFTGGELFLRKDIIELCRFARSLSFDLRLFTNATLITESHARALSALSLS